MYLDHVVNKVMLNNVSRKDQNSDLTCEASNNNITSPMKTTIRLKVKGGNIVDNHIC